MSTVVYRPGDHYTPPSNSRWIVVSALAVFALIVGDGLLLWRVRHAGATPAVPRQVAYAPSAPSQPIRPFLSSPSVHPRVMRSPYAAHRTASARHTGLV